MTNHKVPESGTGYGDPLTWPFWQAAQRHELMIQHCNVCGDFQFYPRPFCLACGGENLDWVIASGNGWVVSKTIVWLEVVPEWRPPYIVAIVQLQEGPTLLTNIVNGECHIGERVRVTWRDRPNAPPFPVFEPA